MMPFGNIFPFPARIQPLGNLYDLPKALDGSRKVKFGLLTPYPTLRLLTAGLIVCVAQAAWAQWSTDSFEGGSPRWLLVDSDCNAQLTEQQISLLLPHNGRTCELLELACGHGTMAILAYPIEPCAIIEEFKPSLWVRSSSGGIQLGVRVVFPFAEHPSTGGRLSTVLWGSAYADTGQWQMLRVEALEEQLRQESIVLRKRFGSNLRLEGAYIDSIVVNGYTGPGRFRLQLDDLELRGMVSMAATGNPPPANWRQDWRWVHRGPSKESRYWARPNTPAVWIQYRGEQLGWLKSLGFTGLVMDQIPTAEQLAEAHRSELDVISPPPTYPIEYPPESLASLKGWLIGAALDHRQANLAQAQAERVSALPVSMHKPLVAEALEDYFRFSRLADQLIVPQPLPAAAGEPREKVEWLAQRLGTTKQRSDGWVSISLGIPPNLTDQFKTALEIVDPTADGEALTIDPLGFRQQLVSSVVSGAKGVFVRTFRPLDLRNTSDSAQLAAIRWVQNDLRLWGPWIVSGQPVRPPTTNDPSWMSASWRIEDSQLIIAQTGRNGSQYCVPPTFQSPLEMGLPSATAGQQVFRLTSGSLERVAVESSPAGLKWRIERPVPVESFLVSSNPVVINFARRHMQAVASQNAADQAEVVSHSMRLAAELASARGRRDEAPDPNEIAHSQALAAAQQQIDSGLQALRSQQFIAATRLFQEASDAIQGVLFDGYTRATENLATPQSSPLVVTAAALPLHWKIADACERSQWLELELPGGSFRDLNGMLQAGWEQKRRLEEKVNLRVELVPPVTSQSGGLRLAAYSLHSDTPVMGGFEGASLRVRSAAVPVEAGQLIRVSATARILHADNQPGSGLLVYDNQVGQSLGQLVRGQPSQSIPVELYRFAVQDGEFRLLAECRGECDIVLEAVRISVIRPATNRSSYSTNPLQSEFWNNPPIND